MAFAIRPSVEADAEAVARWFPDARSLTQWGGPHVRWPFDGAQMRRFLAEGLGTPPLRLCFTAIEDQPVGHFQFVFDWRCETARFGRFGVAPHARGRGLGLALLEQAVTIGFERGVHRLELVVYTFNETARRLYARAGFVHEGTERETTPVGNERWSVHVMSLLRPEWERARLADRNA